MLLHLIEGAKIMETVTTTTIKYAVMARKEDGTWEPIGQRNYSNKRMAEQFLENHLSVIEQFPDYCVKHAEYKVMVQRVVTTICTYDWEVDE